MKRISTARINLITIIIGLIVITLSVLAFVRVDQVKKINEELRNYTKQLEVQLEVKGIELNDCRDELTGTNQLVESLQIKYSADELYISELERRFLKAKSYATIAESILLSNGIEFRRVD